MKSASSAARGSGQQLVQRPATDVEAEAPTDISMEIDDGKRGAQLRVMGPNTRNRIAEKTCLAEAQTSTSAVAITTQEEIDGYRERAMRIAIVGWVELGSTMDLRSCAQVRKHMRKKTKPSLSVVTLTEGERCIYRAASNIFGAHHRRRAGARTKWWSLCGLKDLYFGKIREKKRYCGVCS